MVISKLKNFFSKKQKAKGPDRQDGRQVDFAKIKAGDLEVVMCRRVDFDMPHEFSVLVPRVEIKQRYYHGNRLCEIETIYSSLTIVNSPKYPPAESEASEKAVRRVYKLNRKMD